MLFTIGNRLSLAHSSLLCVRESIRGLAGVGYREREGREREVDREKRREHISSSLVLSVPERAFTQSMIVSKDSKVWTCMTAHVCV